MYYLPYSALTAGSAVSKRAVLGGLLAGILGLILVLPNSALAAPPNDARPGAEFIPSIENGASLARTNVGATIDPGEVSACGSYGRTVWFRFAVPAAGTVVLRTISLNEFGVPGGFMDPVMAIYRDTAASPLACNDDFGGYVDSRLKLFLEPAVYAVQVGGSDNGSGPEQGDFQFTVDYASAGVVDATVRHAWAVLTKGKRKGKTRVKSLDVKTEAGSTVLVKCTKCGFGQKSFSFSSAGELDLRSLFSLLKPNTVIELSITQPTRIGKYFRFQTKKKAVPTETDCRISPSGQVSC